MKSKKGFTLIELLVVIAIIGMLAMILVPAVSSALTSAAMVQTVTNGKSIYEAAFSDQMDQMVGGSSYSAWPEDGDFSTSTDYFINLVTNGAMDVTYDFFAARDIPGAKSSNEADFKAENNAWKLVLNLNSVRDGTPYIFTRNYAISTVPTSEGVIAEDQLLDNNGKPFGTVGLVVVQKGGSAIKLTKKALRQENFNPAGAPKNANLTVIGP
ncbi:MAG: type II secretion system protein [Kiritimatiellae bacterium]|nr:type II secretion system protein [Kiritimatiellia bacterium]